MDNFFDICEQARQTVNATSLTVRFDTEKLEENSKFFHKSTLLRGAEFSENNSPPKVTFEGARSAKIDVKLWSDFL